MAASQAIQARYGRRAGWLRYHMARTLDSVGAFAPLRRVAWNDVERLVFVCQGNICRSAYADARGRSPHRDGAGADPPSRAAGYRGAHDSARIVGHATVASPRRSVRSFARVLRYLLRHHRFGGRADRTPRSAGARTIVEQRG